MAGNAYLHEANSGKNDEFYTQLDDIAKELKYYKQHFQGKVILCNCDDPYESNFFKYFALNFNSLGLKKLIATCYDGSPIAGDELPLLFEVEEEGPKKIAYKVEITEVQDYNGDGAINLADVQYLIQNNRNVLSVLKGNGDFRSQECIELLQEADIVVTNPPFSLFREYVAQLVKYDKKFLILGNMNAITYKEIFPLIKEDKLWIGNGFNLSMVFRTTYPNKLEANRKYVMSKGYDPDKNYVKTPAIAWYTNLDLPRKHVVLDLYKHYTPEEYPHYENYDAINVDRVTEIPIDYEEIMGVPITFMDKYNPDQFEILGMCENEDLYGLKTKTYTTAECKQAYFAKFGKNGTYDLNASGVIIKNEIREKVYQRILIRNKKPQKP